MKAQIINKEGIAWDFKSLGEAKKHIKPKRRDNYEIIDGIAVYDERKEFNS